MQLGNEAIPSRSRRQKATQPALQEAGIMTSPETGRSGRRNMILSLSMRVFAYNRLNVVAEHA